MPSLSRRREMDLRSDRFESEVRMSELQGGGVFKGRERLPYCRRCQAAYEEKSKVCPRCDKKDEMGSLRPIPERFREEARRNAWRKLGKTYVPRRPNEETPQE